jgi:hypothetical protein
VREWAWGIAFGSQLKSLQALLFDACLSLSLALELRGFRQLGD